MMPKKVSDKLNTEVANSLGLTLNSASSLELSEKLSHSVGIAAVERDTGIGKDTLRVWERRYGFPQPLRDALGERFYLPSQVARLRLVKRLLDQGFRPGKLLTQPLDMLDAQLAQSITASTHAPLNTQKPDLATPQLVPAAQAGVGIGTAQTGSNKNKKTLPSTSSISNSCLINTTATDVAAKSGDPTDWIIPLLKNRDVSFVQNGLTQRMAQAGPLGFVLDVLPPLNMRVGNAWLRGEIAVFEEHVYTEIVQNTLRATIQNLGLGGFAPRVLLTTVKSEEHLLGLLMAEMCFAIEGANCVSLGVQTPVTDIVLAAQSKGIDIVALSFSAAYPWRQVRDCLRELRSVLPTSIELWVGGAGVTERVTVPGIVILSNLRDISQAVQTWRRQ